MSGQWFTLLLAEAFNFLHKCFLIFIFRSILHYAITLFQAPHVGPCSTSLPFTLQCTCLPVSFEPNSNFSHFICGTLNTGKHQFPKNDSGVAGISSCSMCPNLFSVHERVKVRMEGFKHCPWFCIEQKEPFAIYIPALPCFLQLFFQGSPRGKMLEINYVIQTINQSHGHLDNFMPTFWNFPCAHISSVPCLCVAVTSTIG